VALNSTQNVDECPKYLPINYGRFQGSVNEIAMRNLKRDSDNEQPKDEAVFKCFLIFFLLFFFFIYLFYSFFVDKKTKRVTLKEKNISSDLILYMKAVI
jgi:hypothetical protein